MCSHFTILSVTEDKISQRNKKITKKQKSYVMKQTLIAWETNHPRSIAQKGRFNFRLKLKTKTIAEMPNLTSAVLTRTFGWRVQRGRAPSSLMNSPPSSTEITQIRSSACRVFNITNPRINSYLENQGRSFEFRRKHLSLLN